MRGIGGRQHWFGAIMASAVFVVSSQAAAQDGTRAASTSASGPSAAAEQACPPPQVIPPALDALLNRMLKPGETFSMAGLTTGMLQDLGGSKRLVTIRSVTVDVFWSAFIPYLRNGRVFLN